MMVSNTMRWQRTILKWLMQTMLLVLSCAQNPCFAEDGTPAIDSELELSAKQVSCSVPGVVCLRLSAINRSATDVFAVRADEASLASSTGSSKALSCSEICDLIDRQEWQKKRDEQFATTIATVGLGTMIVGDVVAKKQDPNSWLGRTTEDRKHSEEMFDERLILQLDHSDGLIYFNGVAPGKNTLKVKRKLWPDNKIESNSTSTEISLEVTIEAPALPALNPRKKALESRRTN